MLTLYFAPGTIALASIITLCETGLEFEARRIDFKKNEQRTPDYLKLNPKGRVPALITDAGVVTETPAILSYLAEIAPQAGLAPVGNAFAAAQLQSFNAWLCSTVHICHAMGRRAIRWTPDEAAHASLKAHVPVTMAACMAQVEADYLQGPWVFGEDYTTADPYLFTICTWLEGDGVDIAAYPKLSQHHQSMLGRTAVQRALAIERGEG
jgi:glutathione S-transferase